MTMKRIFYGAVLLTALFCNACTSPTSNPTTPAAASTAAPEQASAPRQRYWVTEVHVKPDMVNEYREFYQKETMPAYQKAGYKQVNVWTTARLGEAFEFVTIRPIESLQQFDEPDFVSKALGEAGAKAWAIKRGRMIVSSHNYIMQARPELSIAPNPNDMPKLAFVVRRSIAPGRETDYENYIKNDALPILKKASPKGFLMNRVGMGGDGEEYISAALVDSFADYEKWTAALLKEGYDKVTPKRAGIVVHQESAVYRYVPELGLPQPTAPQAGK